MRFHEPRYLIGLIAAIAAFGGGAPLQAAGDAAPATAAATGSATITGKVVLQGAAPAPVKIKMEADPVCQQQHTEAAHTQQIVAEHGGLRYAFVYVKEGVAGGAPAPTTPAVFDQVGCLYAPHVLGVQVGQPVEIRNSDPTLHNVNAKPTQSTPFNLAMPMKGMKITKTFAKREIMVPVKCNVHPWMQAYIGVVDHPFFAVSAADGSFTITGLPAGTYTLEAWHETLGAQTQTVTVADGGTASTTFTFQAK
ncbi:MAG: carboxypeptidase regulatory-like domain-containing protein [Candidatus Omnitrophica bacterium]|nr:carboxypeptidase regulatory-like domain-containing protein [Candidatus Omnitrophota bacterium]